MAKPKKPNRTGVALGTYIPPALFVAFDRYISETQPRTNKSAVVQMLLERFLGEQGYWPPGTTPEPKE